MFGFQIPKDYAEAIRFDLQNNNSKWGESTALEMAQLMEYDTFIDKGVFHESKIPKGYKKITMHLIYVVKHDGRFKSRLVAGGHLTDTPIDSVYSGVVSLRGLRTIIFLGELNDLEPWATDIGNAYLEATTKEKVCIRAGSEFGPLEGHLLIVYKAVYGLKSSGLRFNQLLAKCLRELGFVRSMCESEIWMRTSSNGLFYEYIGTYVDDLCLVMENPQEFLTKLESAPYNFKLKGSGPLSFHLGCGFSRDSSGTLCMDPGKYVEKMECSYQQLFHCKPCQKVMSPLEKGDHPELDTTAFLDTEETMIYQSLIGAMQWSISIGRFDIATAVMSLSSFRAMPRRGHLD